MMHAGIFKGKPSSERKGDRLRWKEPACILTFYVLWIEYFVEKSKKHNRHIEHKFSYCSHSPSPARAGAPSAGSLWHAPTLYSISGFLAKPLLNPATMSGFSSYKRGLRTKKFLVLFYKCSICRYASHARLDIFSLRSNSIYCSSLREHQFDMI